MEIKGLRNTDLAIPVESIIKLIREGTIRNAVLTFSRDNFTTETDKKGNLCWCLDCDVADEIGFKGLDLEKKED